MHVKNSPCCRSADERARRRTLLLAVEDPARICAVRVGQAGPVGAARPWQSGIGVPAPARTVGKGGLQRADPGLPGAAVVQLQIVARQIARPRSRAVARSVARRKQQGRDKRCKNLGRTWHPHDGSICRVPAVRENLASFPAEAPAQDSARPAGGEKSSIPPTNSKGNATIQVSSIATRPLTLAVPASPPFKQAGGTPVSPLGEFYVSLYDTFDPASRTRRSTNARTCGGK